MIEAVVSLLDSEITEEDITNPGIGIRDIVKRISYNEITKFVCQVAVGTHIVFVHENESAKYKILSAFFGESCRQNITNIDSNQISFTKALISSKQTKLSYINNILYYEDLLYGIAES